MTHFRAAFLALGVATLVGCASPQASSPEQRVQVSSRVEVREVAGRRVQAAAVVPWTKADIHHAELTLYLLPTKTKLSSLTLAQADLDQSVKFNDLSILSDYMVEARAWADASGEVPIDNLDLDATSCTTVFETGTTETLDIGTLKLRLQDKLFEGKARGSIGVTDGEVLDTTATPGIELGLN